jgi:hypothetical protein
MPSACVYGPKIPIPLWRTVLNLMPVPRERAEKEFKTHNICLPLFFNYARKVIYKFMVQASHRPTLYLGLLVYLIA